MSTTKAQEEEEEITTESKLFYYYLSFFIIVATFCLAQLVNPWVNLVQFSGAAADALCGISWILLLPAPALLQGLAGLLFYPAVIPDHAPPIEDQLEKEKNERPAVLSSRAPFILFFRIVTRGNNPKLVLANCKTAIAVLERSGLAASRWKVEVVTDNKIDLSEAPSVDQLVVPSDYNPPGGCKYKARALNYAAAASRARAHDWIVHLDEETRFEEETVRHIFAHCMQQEILLASGKTSFPSIGQGVIYYNKGGIENYLTALADTIRVADDYAKFRLQYKLFRLPLIGMHGSFVVCCNKLEQQVGWDWGMVGSITEDTYFAMKLAGQGVRFDWVGGKMFEQSPFSVNDFGKQRARWFSGLWLCVLTDSLPLWQRAYLGSHLVSWTVCPLLTFVTWLNLLTIFPRSSTFVYLMSFIFSIPFWSYSLGFVLGFDPSQFKHGRLEWVLMFLAHISLIPVYTLMESYGVMRGLCDRKTYTGFHIVKKE
ncbi:hypothetical protein GUITHDRAFT_70640, partial [Guillardia theta CCMP2712]